MTTAQGFHEDMIINKKLNIYIVQYVPCYK